MASAEQKKEYKVIKQFKGLNTQPDRTAIDETEFSWLENAQPVGYANLKIIPNSSRVYDNANVAVTMPSEIIYLSSANLQITDYLVFFLADGSAKYYDIQTKTVGAIASAGTFSSIGMNATQWYNDRLLILDPSKGLFSWNGNNVVTIGGVGVIAITNPGSGYITAPTVTLSGPDEVGGVQANAVCSLTSGGANVGFVSLINAGSGYTNGANLTVSFAGGGGSGAKAIAGILTFATGTVNVNVVSGGSGYTTPANAVVSITGGGGTGAAGTAIISGNTVTSVIMTNPGSGYTNTANLVVSLSGGSGTGAVLTGMVNTDKNVGVSSFSGRVWVAQGRTVYYSAAGEYSDFTSVSAGSVTITDSTLHGNIQQLLSANNFLYLFGDDSINVFSDVRVTTSGNTLFTNTNVSASVGSKLSYAIFPYFRSVLFMNNYGIYALVGSTTSKLSNELDGMFPNIDFVTEEVTAGQVLINNILCAAFNFRYYDAIFTKSFRYLQAVFFEKKWFLTNQGVDNKYTVSVPVNGVITMFGTTDTNLYQMYSDAVSPIKSIVQTALLDMKDPIRTKQALKIGVEATSTANTSLTLSVTVDNENRSSSPYTLTSIISWQNQFLQTVGWSNNLGSNILWGTVGYDLYMTDAQQYGKYLGITVTSSNPNYVLNGFEFEHELRTRF